jgi:hypothetical protein
VGPELVAAVPLGFAAPQAAVSSMATITTENNSFFMFFLLLKFDYRIQICG